MVWMAYYGSDLTCHAMELSTQLPARSRERAANLRTRGGYQVASGRASMVGVRSIYKVGCGTYSASEQVYKRVLRRDGRQASARQNATSDSEQEGVEGG